MLTRGVGAVLLYPGVSSRIFSIFQCRQIGSVNYLARSLLLIDCHVAQCLAALRSQRFCTGMRHASVDAGCDCRSDRCSGDVNKLRFCSLHSCQLTDLSDRNSSGVLHSVVPQAQGAAPHRHAKIVWLPVRRMRETSVVVRRCVLGSIPLVDPFRVLQSVIWRTSCT